MYPVYIWQIENSTYRVNWFLSHMFFRFVINSTLFLMSLFGDLYSHPISRLSLFRNFTPTQTFSSKSHAKPHGLASVSAISVDPRPTASPTGRQLCQVVGQAVRQLDWGDAVDERGSRSAGQDVEHRPPNVFIVEYRLVNPMTIHVVLAVRVTVIQAVMILASPPTRLLLQYCTM